MAKFLANLGFLWTDIPLPAAIHAAKSVGFDAVECHWPYKTPADEIVTALEQTGLTMLVINTVKGEGAGFGLSLVPGQEKAARLAINQAIPFARKLGLERCTLWRAMLRGRRQKRCLKQTLPLPVPVLRRQTMA